VLSYSWVFLPIRNASPPIEAVRKQSLHAVEASHSPMDILRIGKKNATSYQPLVAPAPYLGAPTARSQPPCLHRRYGKPPSALYDASRLLLEAAQAPTALSK
jgi:hypothetical protein